MWRTDSLADEKIDRGKFTKLRSINESELTEVCQCCSEVLHLVLHDLLVRVVAVKTQDAQLS